MITLFFDLIQIVDYSLNPNVDSKTTTQRGQKMKSGIQQLTEKRPDVPPVQTRITCTLYLEDLALIDGMAKEFDLTRAQILTRIIGFGCQADYLYLKETSHLALERIVTEIEDEQKNLRGTEGPHSKWALDFHNYKELWQGN